MKRIREDEVEYAVHRTPESSTSGLPMFDAVKETPKTLPSSRPLIRALPTGHIPEEHLKDRDAIQQYLKYHAAKIAQELAEKRGYYGVSASDVRMEGARRCLWVHKQFTDLRTWAFLPGMFKRLGLVQTGRERMSDVPGAKNNNQVYVLHRFAPRQERAG